MRKHANSVSTGDDAGEETPACAFYLVRFPSLTRVRFDTNHAVCLDTPTQRHRAPRTPPPPPAARETGREPAPHAAVAMASRSGRLLKKPAHLREAEADQEEGSTTAQPAALSGGRLPSARIAKAADGA